MTVQGADKSAERKRIDVSTYNLIRIMPAEGIDFVIDNSYAPFFLRGALFFPCGKDKTMNKSLSLKITESAIMIALSTILSIATFVEMPFGGSVTILSMLPIIIIAYRHGTSWGLLTGFVYSLMQMLLGLKSFSYVAGFGSVMAVAFLDYIFAFIVLGLGGVFRNVIKNKGLSLAAGALLACVLRYAVHVISGYVVWRDISIPANDAWLYSILYNLSYMLPETILTVVGAYFAGKIFVLDGEQIKRIPATGELSRGIYAALPVCVAVAISSVFLFQMMGNEETPFDITLLTTAEFYQWLTIIAVMLCGIAASVIVSKLKKQKIAE